MNKAYSLLNVKAVSESGGVVTVEGIASTPTSDVVNDIMDPMGARFKTPMPFMLHHDSKLPVGQVVFAKPTPGGIPFRAELPIVKEPGVVQDRVNEAIHSLKYKLIGAVSIGFRAVEGGAERLKNGGTHFKQWAWHELSMVTVPANPEAVITGVKSIDSILRAATGLTQDGIDPPPGASGNTKHPAKSGVFYSRSLKGIEMKTTIAEQIKLFEAKLEAAEEGASGIVNKSIEEGRTLDEHETEQRAQFVAETESVRKHIAMLKEHEQLMLGKATPVASDAGRDPVAAQPSSPITVKSNLPAGLRFTRFAIALAEAKGNVMMAREIADQRYKDTPEIGQMLKAAVSMGGSGRLAEAAITKAAVTSVNSTDTAVTQYADIQSEFVELLRPKMILGRMTSLVRVPIYSRVARQLTGVSGSFVGEGSPKPVNKQTYDNITLGPAKAAVIVVMSDEAVRFSTIAAEMRARDDMVKGVSTYLDKRFMDPSYSGVANVSPASITNGATRIQSSGITLAAIDADVRSAMAMFATSDVDPSTAVWVMPATVALRLSMKRNTNDELAFPGLSMQGGTWYGIPVIVSNAMVTSGSPAELQIALVTQSEVMMADDGGISIDMSTEASVQMNDAPSAGAQSLVSLWQNNLVGIRAEQYINWTAMRPSNLGIALIENTNY